MKDRIKAIKDTIIFYEKEKAEFISSKEKDEDRLKHMDAGTDKRTEMLESIAFTQEFIVECEESLKKYKERLKELSQP